MPRQPRVESIGFHHIINRGVARGNIFLKPDDYEKFLEILEDAKLRYDFFVHSFCLMSNHYHLLVETKNENLSLIARQINSKYAQYFNREYKRVGPLWQGRFKNYYVHDESYLCILLRYIERNPIKAKMTQDIGKYKWSASTSLLVGLHVELLDGSMLLDKELFALLETEISEKELEKLDTLQKTKYTQENETTKRQKQRTLNEYFDTMTSFKQRDKSIKEAVQDGYKQSEIAEFLQLSRTTISKIMAKLSNEK
jgi:REP element-mobilizing transposase RayT